MALEGRQDLPWRAAERGRPAPAPGRAPVPIVPAQVAPAPAPGAGVVDVLVRTRVWIVSDLGGGSEGRGDGRWGERRGGRRRGGGDERRGEATFSRIMSRAIWLLLGSPTIVIMRSGVFSSPLGKH